MNDTNRPAPQKGHLPTLTALLTLATLGACAIGDQPGGMFYVRGGLGTTTVETDGSPDTDTDAFNAEIAVEGQGRVVGGGVRLSGFQSDDELGGPGSDTTLTTAALFPHLTIRPAAGIFRMPIRIGPEVRWNNLDIGGLNAVKTDSYAAGGAVEIEPEIDLFRGERAALSVYGRGHGGVAAGAIETTIGTADETFTTTATLLGAEAGLRFQIAKFLIAGGYVWQSTVFDETDAKTLGAAQVTLPETTLTNDGFFLSIGIRW